MISCLQPDVLPERTGPISVSDVSGTNAIYVAWQDGVCDAAIVFTFDAFSDSSGYGLSGERPSSCPDGPSSSWLQINFRQPVAADDVHPRLVDGPVAGICSHAVTDVVLAPAIVTDETGLVETCGSADSVRQGNEALVVLENIDDPTDRVIQLLWYGGACQTDTTVDLSRKGDRFVLRLDKGEQACEETAIRRVRMQLSEPIDISLIDLIEPTDLACHDTDGPHDIPMLLKDDTGLAIACEQTPVAMASENFPSTAAIYNGDPLLMVVRWRQPSCFGPVNLRLLPDAQGGYVLQLTRSGGPPTVCVDFAQPISDYVQRGAVIRLEEAIDPASVTVLPEGLF